MPSRAKVDWVRLVAPCRSTNTGAPPATSVSRSSCRPRRRLRPRARVAAQTARSGCSPCSRPSGCRPMSPGTTCRASTTWVAPGPFEHLGAEGDTEEAREGLARERGEHLTLGQDIGVLVAHVEERGAVRRARPVGDGLDRHDHAIAERHAVDDRGADTARGRRAADDDGVDAARAEAVRAGRCRRTRTAAASRTRHRPRAGRRADRSGSRPCRGRRPRARGT